MGDIHARLALANQEHLKIKAELAQLQWELLQLPDNNARRLELETSNSVLATTLEALQTDIRERTHDQNERITKEDRQQTMIEESSLRERGRLEVQHPKYTSFLPSCILDVVPVVLTILPHRT